MTRARERAKSELDGSSRMGWWEIAVASALVAWFYIDGFITTVRWITSHL